MLAISPKIFHQLVAESLYSHLLAENQLPEDENGNYYHGTSNKWNVHRGGFLEDNGAIWFAESEYYAWNYTKINSGKVIAVQLKYNNPFDAGEIDTEEDFVWDSNELVITRDEQKQVNSLTFKRFKSYAERLGVDVWKLVDIFFNETAGECIFNLTRTPEFAELCKKAGYDAIKATESGSPTIGVFSNKQIRILKVLKTRTC